MVSDVFKGRFMLSAWVRDVDNANCTWWLTVVYGRQLDAEKVEFLAELLQFRAMSPGPWFLCGDFNMIYRAQDKNNGRLDQRCMRRFRTFINQAQLEEINMVDRLYMWSSECDRPTLELLDRMFATSDWFAKFPNHILRPLSSNCSDHCPLLLMLNAFGGAKR